MAYPNARALPTTGPTLATLRKPSLFSVTAGVLALVVAISLWLAFRGPKLSAEATAAALQKELHTPYGFSCKPEENDGTIEGLGDVDYVCSADRVNEPGYWVGTDGSKITGMQSMG
jgi:hypothetical protein